MISALHYIWLYLVLYCIVLHLHCTGYIHIFAYMHMHVYIVN